MKIQLGTVGLFLASAIVVVGQQRPAISDIVANEAALTGHSKMAVVIVIEGIRDVSDESFRADIEGALRRVGIRTFPPTENPRTYPFLDLTVTADIMHGSQPLISVYSLTLDFFQLFPLPGGKYMKASTWQTGRFGASPSIQIVGEIKDSVSLMVHDFLADWRKAN